jgi:hypothetical protein
MAIGRGHGGLRQSGFVGSLHPKHAPRITASPKTPRRRSIITRPSAAARKVRRTSCRSAARGELSNSVRTELNIGTTSVPLVGRSGLSASIGENSALRQHGKNALTFGSGCGNGIKRGLAEVGTVSSVSSRGQEHCNETVVRRSPGAMQDIVPRVRTRIWICAVPQEHLCDSVCPSTATSINGQSPNSLTAWSRTAASMNPPIVPWEGGHAENRINGPSWISADESAFDENIPPQPLSCASSADPWCRRRQTANRQHRACPTTHCSLWHQCDITKLLQTK